jgi:three-Cys-motif partner protein
MAAPKSTTWQLEPHTAAKHAILRRYLSAWLPILSQGSFGTVVYIDAFAGPGVYSGGEDGSPVIALKELIGHRAELTAKAVFHFVELDDDRAAMLEQRVKGLLASASMAGRLEAHS